MKSKKKKKKKVNLLETDSGMEEIQKLIIKGTNFQL